MALSCCLSGKLKEVLIDGVLGMEPRDTLVLDGVGKVPDGAPDPRLGCREIWPAKEGALIDGRCGTLVDGGTKG